MNKRGEIHLRDCEALALDPRFLRFISTVLREAGIHQTAYGVDGRNLAYAEGRRSLGFEILGMLERTRPDALIAILQSELSALKENPDEHREYDPRSDLPGSDDLDGSAQRAGRRDDGAGTFLDYRAFDGDD